MPFPEPVPGLVISYAYLWRSEQERGREEGAKDRPCVIVLSVDVEADEKIVTVAPVTHSPPRSALEAIELPTATKRRLGLDDQRSWLVATELNRFRWPGPDLRPIHGKPGVFTYGLLPEQLIIQLRQCIATLQRARRLKVVARDADGDSGKGR